MNESASHLKLSVFRTHRHHLGILVTDLISLSLCDSFDLFLSNTHSGTRGGGGGETRERKGRERRVTETDRNREWRECGGGEGKQTESGGGL